MSRPNKSGLIRISGSRSSGGCITCKSRRVKCDEQKPGCARCLKLFRKCGGYERWEDPAVRLVGRKFVHYIKETKDEDAKPTLEVSSLQPPPRAWSSEQELDQLALRSLEFYVRATSLQLGNSSVTETLSKGLFRLMHEYVAVRHCMITLAMFQRSLVHKDMPDLEGKHMQLGLTHYNKSIQAVVQVCSEDSAHTSLVGLTACLLYCAIEIIQGHYNSGMKHVEAGMKLLCLQERAVNQRQDLDSNIGANFIDAIRLLLVGLQNQMESIQHGDMDEEEMREFAASVEDLPLCYEFTTPEQALAEFSELQNDIWTMVELVDWHYDELNFPSSTLVRVGQKLELQLLLWTTAYQNLLTRSTNNDTSTDQPYLTVLLILQVEQMACQIELKLRFESQMAYDRYTEEFNSIVRFSEQFLALNQPQNPSGGDDASSSPVFTISVGVIPALFYTVARCREPLLRRHALRILRSMRRRESVWDSKVVSIVAERLIELEETAATQYWREICPHKKDYSIKKAEDIPGHCRVNEFQAKCGTSAADFQAVLGRLLRSRPNEVFLVWDAEVQGKTFKLTSAAFVHAQSSVCSSNEDRPSGR